MKRFLTKETYVNSMMDSTVIMQTSSHSVPSTPSWFGEVVLIIEYLRKQGVLTKLSEGVRFSRRRFGQYEVIDFFAVLFGYAISGERTLEAFYQRLQPFAVPFMALFERDRLPSRSALSRFLAQLSEGPVEALRTLFLDDLESRPLTTDSNEKQTGGLVDRAGSGWVVFDIDGTREAARQRALPQTEDVPPPFRRLDDVCAAGYTGRKRGEVVRTRTVISQAHSFQWLGSVGNRGNGRYRQELRQGLSAIRRYLTAHQLQPERALLRLDGQYGTGAVLSDLAGFGFVTRGKEYAVLDHPLVQARLHLPPDQFQQRPESQISRSLYDCPEVPVGPEGVLCRVVVATHPASNKKSPVGVTRAGVVYELFFTKLPQQAFTASDVVELYLHRGAFEPALADEDQEIDPDRWCSHAACGQEVWCIVSQWVWNLRAVRWGINFFSLSQCARPNLRRLCPLLHRTRLPPPAMLPRRWACPGKLAASQAKTLLSSPMGHCGVRLIRSFSPMSSAEKLTGACASCMEPVSAGAVPVRCASNASGRAAPPRSRARSACSCIRLWSGRRRFSGVTGVGGSIAGRASNWSAINTSRSKSNLPSLAASLSRLCPFPGQSGRTIGFHGRRGSLAMPVSTLLNG